MKRPLIAAVVLFVAAPILGPAGALAGPWEDGMAAYVRGDYVPAIQLFRPLAQTGQCQGARRARHHVPQGAGGREEPGARLHVAQPRVRARRCEGQGRIARHVAFDVAGGTRECPRDDAGLRGIELPQLRVLIKRRVWPQADVRTKKSGDENACRRLDGLALPAARLFATPAAAQKKGGTLRLYHNDLPPSTSLHEESTIASVTPFAAVFNNLVVFDPAKPHESLDTVIPDLAESWSWDATNTRLTFKLRQGVKWHDGQPFTAKDVQCTWRMLIGKGETADFHRNPRKVWYSKLQDVSINGDYEATFELSEPQPSLLVLLASAFSPVYPCHVPQQAMRTKPVGTGPFKLVDFRRGAAIRLVRNPDYFKKDRPYLDEITFTVIDSRATRMLAFSDRRVRHHLSLRCPSTGGR